MLSKALERKANLECKCVIKLLINQDFSFFCKIITQKFVRTIYKSHNFIKTSIWNYLHVIFMTILEFY